MTQLSQKNRAIAQNFRKRKGQI
uniref:Uncharacterized protein n=1 Tax=Amphimedon queenslandica TaxID=400682 RepID=A0A1X7VJ65_AMPQE